MPDNSFRSFPGRMRKRAEQLARSMERATRAGALAADRAAVAATPVDTGNARSNWFVSVRAPKVVVSDNRGVGGPGPATAKATAQARAAVKTFRITDGVIYLVNGVQYIRPLDQGYSKKGGFMVAAALLAAPRAIRAELARRGIFQNPRGGQ